MAEAIVSLAIRRISEVLIHEAVFLHGVNEEVERLKAELKRIQCFLKDAELKQEQNERVRNWVAEIRDLAYDAEDVIDTFILKVAHKEGFHGIVKKSTSIFTKPFHLHKVGTQIKTIQTRLEDIRNSLQTYDIKFEGEASASSAMNIQQQLRRSHPHFEEEDAVGLVDAMKEVLGQLMKEEEKLGFVSIVGMGGIGKTTLAKKVYNCIDVKKRFDCCAWAFISQQCFAGEVLRKILIDVGEKRELVNQLKEEELYGSLYDFLKEKRYLVALDDSWKNEDWDKIKQAFPKGKRGSKILFTTRKKEVALHADPCCSLVETQLLTNDESWELLHRKAFLRNTCKSHDRLQEFEKLGREMVKKCGGLPLAIIVLGGLLATKESLDEWEKVNRRIRASMSEFQQEDHPYYRVNGILALSYNDLPFHLKPCFLYLAHYPEDWEISTKKLIRLWIAEGFISPSLEVGGEELLMEDVAEQYLEKLINRCLVQVEKRGHTGKGVKTCRIHDLLRDLCVFRAKDEKFMGIIPLGRDENENYIFRLPSTSSKPRRIAGHLDERSSHYLVFKMYVCDDLEQEYSKVRSILLYRDEEVILHISNAFKLLRVLKLVRKNADDWGNRSELNAPDDIGNLVHLRYLALENVYVYLPWSIGNLKRLQTLYVRGPSEVPNVLFKLKSLRHLSIGLTFGRSLQIGTLENIITLKIIAAKNLIKNNAVLNLTKIRSLGIEFERSEEVEVILKSNIFRSNRLHSLYMEMRGESYPDLGPLSHCHQLSRLEIVGKLPEDLHSVHHVFEFLPASIATLHLWESELKQDPMPSLEKLPNLRNLRLHFYTFLGSKMVCSANGFSQLDRLELVSLPELEEWEIEEDAMPRIKRLSLRNVSKLRMVPEGLRYVKTLQELELTSMKSSLVKRIQEIEGREGEDFYKVRHIPSITIRRT